VLAVASNLAQLPDPSISQMQRIIKNPNLSHPTAFIPQGDLPENRTFRVLGSFINSYQLKIFNRWGELMFESFDPENGWDGTYRGQRMPEGTYVFQARVTDFAGRSFDYAGTVVLLKKG
jgi:gliding motility-associated-like protein